MEPDEVLREEDEQDVQTENEEEENNMLSDINMQVAGTIEILIF